MLRWMVELYLDMWDGSLGTDSSPSESELFKTAGLSYCRLKDSNWNSPVLNFPSVYSRISGERE